MYTIVFANELQTYKKFEQTKAEIKDILEEKENEIYLVISEKNNITLYTDECECSADTYIKNYETLQDMYGKLESFDYYVIYKLNEIEY